jgi:hypothetical protein
VLTNLSGWFPAAGAKKPAFFVPRLGMRCETGLGGAVSDRGAQPLKRPGLMRNCVVIVRPFHVKQTVAFWFCYFRVCSHRANSLLIADKFAVMTFVCHLFARVRMTRRAIASGDGMCGPPIVRQE